MNTIEILEEDNTMVLDDDYGHTSIELRPETKLYKSIFHLKEDVYYRNELYEYKILLDPIIVKSRLLERIDEPPERIVVQDGVVIEEEMRSGNTFSEDLVVELKKQIEWSEEKYYPLVYYILSKHPEIISRIEYRRFLRQIEERIKLGLSKIENHIKTKDLSGLEVVEGKYGKEISYPSTPKVSDEQAHKRYEYIKQQVYTPLFNSKSPQYSGISQYEFESSSEILKYVESLLNSTATSGEGVPKSDKPKDRVRWLSYSWGIIIGIIELFVAVSILSAATSRFEEIVISSLVILYVSIRGIGSGLFFTTFEQLQKADKQFLYLLKTINSGAFESQKSELREVIKEDNGKTNKAKVKVYISVVFMVIMYFIAIYHLMFTNFIQ